MLSLIGPEHVQSSQRGPLVSPQKNRLGVQDSLALPGPSLDKHLSAYFDPTTCQKRDMETGMTQFYSIQLQEANKMIQTLHNETIQLREEIRRLRMGYISQSNKLQEKLLQMRLEMYETTSMGLASQPLMRHVHPPYASFVP
ncbi:uncharacterized protein VP01_2671g4 [Puccinia sorghi]|uniref:Uncharacterized protein n=1 Tax=Puccinia sorghi TaxID=27349 RepID=A0A0L6V405_9BASI|nr:uncharacterized protein VP01_2671g4 [Puccinia sorghi]